MGKFITIIFLLITFAVSGSAGARLTPKEPPRADVLITNQGLPVVGSYEKLKSLLAEASQEERHGLGIAVTDALFSTPFKTKAAVQESARAGADTGVAYSQTNVQVQGVDEADVVKTDGQYLYQVNNERVVVAKVYPADSMEIVNTLKFKGQNFSPFELYIDQNYLVILGHSNQPFPVDAGVPSTMKEMRIAPDIYPIHSSTVKVLVYDIRDKSNIKKVRDAEVEGNYVSSRKIGPNLYLVANKYLDYYRIMEENQPESKNITPFFRDSAGKEFTSVPYEDIRYFPNSPSSNYLIIAGLNLDQPNKEMQVSTYLGAGENIYVSQENLYVAVTQYEQVNASITPVVPQFDTVLYRFELQDGAVKYQNKGQVPGTILNQFSMDEYKGYFRIATTKGDMWRNDEFTSKNNVYILNNDMEITGKIEDIAPGEKIYSSRFLGDRGYMVTFKTVDPLFVLDLKDPKAPKILGALKIPGYSDYLHPYDENHIIGFGKDAVEVTQKDWEGKNTNMAFYQGLKIALFDVSDVKNPVEKFKIAIGDRGTESELLHNHKALLFDRSKDLLAFPVTLMEIKNKTGDATQYGEFIFQGIYVYDLNLTQGFYLKGRITHLTPDDYLKAAREGYDYNKTSDRALYIGETLYTLSKAMIKANNLSDLQETANLPIPN